MSSSFSGLDSTVLPNQNIAAGQAASFSLVLDGADDLVIIAAYP